MRLTGLLVDAVTVAAVYEGFSAVALGWRYKPDADVAVLVVVPIHESHHPGAGTLDVGEWIAGVVRPVQIWPLLSVARLWDQALRIHTRDTLSFHLAPALLQELAPKISCGITAHVPTGCQEGWRICQGAAGIHEVHRVSTPALGVPVEQCRVSGFEVLDPGPSLHGVLLSTPVLACAFDRCQARVGRWLNLLLCAGIVVLARWVRIISASIYLGPLQVASGLFTQCPQSFKFIDARV